MAALCARFRLDHKPPESAPRRYVSAEGFTEYPSDVIALMGHAGQTYVSAMST